MNKLKQLIEQVKKDLEVYEKIVEDKKIILEALEHELRLEESVEEDVPF